MLIQSEGVFAFQCKHKSSNSELRMTSLKHILPKQLKSDLYCTQRTLQIISRGGKKCLQNFSSVCRLFMAKLIEQSCVIWLWQCAPQKCLDKVCYKDQLYLEQNKTRLIWWYIRGIFQDSFYLQYSGFQDLHFC